jgi:hypothetical protein
VEWASYNIEKYFAERPIRGVLVLGHSLRSPRTRPFFESLATHFASGTGREKIPVMYLHGDGHDFDVDKKFSHQLHWRNYWDVQVDMGALADPIIVEVAAQVNGEIVPLQQEHENQLVVGRGLFRIDRQRGTYEGGNPKIPKKHSK